MIEESFYDPEHPECWIYDPELLSKVYDEIMQSIIIKIERYLKKLTYGGFRNICFALYRVVLLYKWVRRGVGVGVHTGVIYMLSN